MSLGEYNLPKPFFALAPMANITTYPFASQCAEFGADVVWTPMVHTDTILNNWEEARKILDFKDIGKYIVQIVGSDPEKVANSIKIVQKNLKPTGIDLNFSCPDKNIVKSGCGGALMKEPDRIKEIVGSALSVSKLPVSAKLRSGWDNHEDIFDIAEMLSDLGVSMITVHPRTVKEGFRGKADWSVVKKLVNRVPSMIICGSGDISGALDARLKQKDTGCAGIMIGRRALGKPWIFREIMEGEDYDANVGEIKHLVLDIAEKSNEIWGDRGITEAKKHFAWYFRGFPGAAEVRKKLMESQNLSDVQKNLLE